jgi:hypothetical protein
MLRRFFQEIPAAERVRYPSAAKAALFIHAMARLKPCPFKEPRSLRAKVVPIQGIRMGLCRRLACGDGRGESGHAESPS